MTAYRWAALVSAALLLVAVWPKRVAWEAEQGSDWIGAA